MVSSRSQCQEKSQQHDGPAHSFEEFSIKIVDHGEKLHYCDRMMQQLPSLELAKAVLGTRLLYNAVLDFRSHSPLRQSRRPVTATRDDEHVAYRKQERSHLENRTRLLLQSASKFEPITNVGW